MSRPNKEIILISGWAYEIVPMYALPTYHLILQGFARELKGKIDLLHCLFKKTFHKPQQTLISKTFSSVFSIFAKLFAGKFSQILSNILALILNNFRNYL